MNLDSVPIHIINENEYHICSYNNNDADYGTTEFEQIPFGDRLNYGFLMTIID